MSYNVNGLLHIVDDVITLGAVYTFSAFSCENLQQQLQRIPVRYVKNKCT